MATYLVTGGCGFIGSHLCQELVDMGHNVRVIDNLSSGSTERLPKECDIVFGNVNDMKLIQEMMEDIDGCYHLAGMTPANNFLNCNELDNIVSSSGLRNVLYWAKSNQYRDEIPVVYASSAMVYGDNANLHLNENDILRPTNRYSVEKICSELDSRVANIQYGVPAIGLRFFNVYGPHQDMSSPYSKIINLIINQMLIDSAIHIPGNSKQTSDYIFIDDATSALFKAMNSNKKTNEIYNVCSGKAIPNDQIVNTLLSLSGKSLPIIYDLDKTGFINVSIGNNKKIEKELNFKVKTDITEGLRHTYHSFMKNHSEEVIIYAAGVSS